MKYLPYDTLELIEQLDKNFPHECIQPNESEIAAHRRAGKRELIDYLIDLRNKTEKRQLADQQSIGD